MVVVTISILCCAHTAKSQAPELLKTRRSLLHTKRKTAAPDFTLMRQPLLSPEMLRSATIKTTINKYCSFCHVFDPSLNKQKAQGIGASHIVGTPTAKGILAL